ncbi:MAG: GNAT family N-acetyltransferase [Candidatus Dormibacteraeota bacterium]|nr:GNAT family N-acetyltransferase [Candidatus Dormibacteraeota bacterium]
MKLRSASLKDLGRIEQIHRDEEARFSSEPPPARLWSLVSQTLTALLPLGQESLLYVAEEGGRVVGFVQASGQTPALTLPPRPTVLQVLNVCVAAEAGEDVAARLIEHLVEQAGAKGVHRLFVRVPLDDPLLVTFRRHGFRQFATEKVLFAEAPRGEGPGEPRGARPGHHRDDPRLYNLYRRVTPAEVARLEAPTYREWRAIRSVTGQQEVVDRTEIVAAWRFQRGSGARPHILSFMALPEAELAEDLADRATHACDGQPAWAGLRHYDALMIDALRGRGFSGLLDQALLVRDSLVRTPRTEKALVPSFG